MERRIEEKRLITFKDLRMAYRLVIPDNYVDMVFNSLPLAQEWISVKDRLPEDNTWVLVCNKRGYITIACVNTYRELEWRNRHNEKINVIAYMPLPSPFEERV